MARRTRWTREVWAERVEQWKRSGQSAAAYAAQIGVHATTFGSWVRKLQQGDPESGSEQATGGSRSAAGVSFVELVAPLEAAGAERFEVVLRSGVQLRVPVGFQSEALRRLLDVLELR